MTSSSLVEHIFFVKFKLKNRIMNQYRVLVGICTGPYVMSVYTYVI
jgi:hypothetical protein